MINFGINKIKFKKEPNNALPILNLKYIFNGPKKLKLLYDESLKYQETE